MAWDGTSDQHELARERTAEAKRRTHLANERTYAAWVRTALALIGLGVGIAGYFHLAGDSRGKTFVAIGLTFVGGGALMALVAAYAYHRTYRSIEAGEYGAAASLTFVLGLIPVLLGLLALLVIVLQ